MRSARAGAGRCAARRSGAFAPCLLAICGVLLLLANAGPPAAAADPRVTVGSKAFPESWILAEALAIEMRAEGIEPVEHRRNLGGTEVVLQALRAGDVDVYPEYTGTIDEVILHATRRLSAAARAEELARIGLGISDPIGFNDSYGIAVSAQAQERLGLRTISDLARHPDVRLGLTHEFLGRPDGWPGLASAYGMRAHRVLGIEHQLAYGALVEGRIDGTDVYTTDAQIEKLGLRVLEDDRHFFPRYDAVWLFRLDLREREPRAIEAIERLTGVIDERRMIRANARVVLEGMEAHEAAESLLAETVRPGRGSSVGAGGGGGAGAAAGAGTRSGAETGAGGSRPSLIVSILRNTGQHLRLVSLSLLAAILIGVPLGIAASYSRLLAGAILSVAGLLQTVPSLALLAILIPLFGIGAVPAMIALFLYSLLPIVRNTYVGLTTIAPALLEAAEAIGLSGRARLLLVRLPLASPSVMAGIKTSAVINVGTATLAALIGAGGLGEPILSGIQLRQSGRILQGAIPAALLALAVQRLFDLLDRVVIPRGLRIELKGR
ncbi:MAG: glycine betaine ABC transporter substrate-binding protein [Candidatus Eisenbacteria bacterium]|nr:glycine betaine ABC transporter substrate-binding protein [Candidatus Eisenbacteria bacterium]